MGQISLSIPQSGQPNSTEDPKIASDLSTIQTVINGNLDVTNLSPTIAVLQLFTAGTARKIKWAGPVNTNVGFDSTSGRSSLNGLVAHGMALTPVWAIIIPSGRVATTEGPTVVPAAAVTSVDGTNINYSMTINGTSNNGAAFWWAAIG